MVDKILLNKVLNRFPAIEDKVEIEPLTGGLINQSFKITDKGGNKFLLQKINTGIFKDVDALMNNIRVVTRHVEKKLQEGNNNPDYRISKFYPCDTGKLYCRFSSNDYWRLCDYIDNVKPQNFDSLHIAKETGRILAMFHVLTNDLDVAKLKVTLPGFHDLPARKKSLDRILKNRPSRLKESEKVYEELKKYDFLSDWYKDVAGNYNLPLFTVHNDPKVSNILFNKDGKALCLIDLDTLMPGYRGFDFGDAVRSLCNKTHEDDPDPGNAGFDEEKYNVFKNSYLNTAKDILANEEMKALEVFPLFLAYEQAVRFYTDYLQGDKYYHIDTPGQNLTRTQVQLRMLKEMYKSFSPPV